MAELSILMRIITDANEIESRMANEFEYFSFHPRRFLADDVVECMTAEAVGAYCLLLFRAWDQVPPGSIPADDAVLARWARMDADSWSRIKPMVTAAFKFRGKRWHQKFMQEVFERIKKERDSKSIGGKKGAKSRWNKKKDRITEPIGEPWDTHRDTSGIRTELNRTELNGTETTSSRVVVQPPDGDEIDSEIRAFIGGNSMLNYDPATHGKCRELVRMVGWEQAQILIGEGVALRAPFPVGWAVGKARNLSSPAKSSRDRQMDRIDQLLSQPEDKS
ncbi:MAG TPA: DUF1376 domain-containing protein [Planctomycetaceae bacterium]|jgi:uncharacterized protein YdaU (DUF1376 family)